MIPKHRCTEAYVWWDSSWIACVTKRNQREDEIRDICQYPGLFACYVELEVYLQIFQGKEHSWCLGIVQRLHSKKGGKRSRWSNEGLAQINAFQYFLNHLASPVFTVADQVLVALSYLNPFTHIFLICNLFYWLCVSPHIHQSMLKPIAFIISLRLCLVFIIAHIKFCLFFQDLHKMFSIFMVPIRQ
jgi:hypothetical protein